ncbi:MAG: FMN-binding protein [Atopobiaceae bacterium]|nr:FMN-binding protein [Atopobiaceae bacterium]
MKKLGICTAAALGLTIALVGCGGGGRGELHDGTYTAQSMVWEDTEEGNGSGYGVITVTVADGKITEAEFVTYEPDGTIKDESYGMSGGKIANQDFYNKAQRAVAANAEYCKQLVAVQNPDGVDVISGATISHGEFVEAANLALDEAAK